MIHRRRFLQQSSALATATWAGNSTAVSSTSWRMPDEAEPHSRTWMAFGASQHIWGRRLLPVVQKNLATLANTISRFEPVNLLVRRSDLSIARRLVDKSVNLITTPLDDLWVRDTGPVFATDGTGKKAAIDFNFNGWGEKQEHRRDAQVAKFIGAKAGAKVIRSELCLEGGGIEVDGHGTAIISESCVLIANRNPGVTKGECETELKRLLGLKKIIWLPGIRGRDITDGHTDFYARFAGPGVVLAGYDPDPESFDHTVTKRHLRILRAATDAQGRRLKIQVLRAPSRIRPQLDSADFAAGYIGFYACNGAIISPHFGDPQADRAAKATLQSVFPNRKIIQLNVDGIAAGGGSIHCATQQEPRA